MSEPGTHSRMWKLLGVILPALITGYFSYLKSKTEAKDQGKASYEALKTALDTVQGDLKASNEHSAALEAEVKELSESVQKLETRAQPLKAPPPEKPAAAGMRMRSKPEQHQLDLPEKFEDVVEKFKAAKK